MCNTILQEVGVWEKWREKSKEEVKDRIYNSNEAKELKECEWFISFLLGTGFPRVWDLM